MDHPEEPIHLEFFHQTLVSEDLFLGSLTISPAELCRKLPANGWWPLEGVESGEVAQLTALSLCGFSSQTKGQMQSKRAKEPERKRASEPVSQRDGQSESKRAKEPESQ